MRHLRFVQLDVFTSKPFGGNQLAVFQDAQSLSDAEMQSIAREMNYSESTFITPASDPKALCRVRIFTPATELPFAGHPVVGTTWALAYLGSNSGRRLAGLPGTWRRHAAGGDSLRGTQAELRLDAPTSPQV